MNFSRCSQISLSWKWRFLAETGKSFSRKVCGPGFSVIKNQTLRPTNVILGGYWPIRNDYISKTKLWENNQHFASSPLVSPRNDVSGTSKEIPHWWRVTAQIWMFISATCTNIREAYLFCSKLWFVTDLKAVSFLTLRYACPFQDHTWLVNLLLMSYWRLGMWDILILDTCHQLSLRVWEQFQVHLKTTGEINVIKELRRQLIKCLLKQTKDQSSFSACALKKGKLTRNEPIRNDINTCCWCKVQ